VSTSTTAADIPAADIPAADIPAADLEAQHREAALTGMGLAWWASRHPERPAITSETGDRTFAELNAGANRMARLLRERGLVEGDAVALVCTNRPEFAETVFACQRAGLRLTPINWHLTGDEASYIVTDCGARAVVADAALPPALLEAIVASPAEVRVVVGGPVDGFEAYEEVVAGQDPADLADPVLGTQMLYTSGTTGRPKGVHRSPEVARAMAAAPRLNLYGYATDGDGDRHLCTGPLYHAAPLAFSLVIPLAFGVGVVVMRDWDPEATLALVDRYRITHTHMVPTMFHRLLSLPDEVRARYDTSSLRNVLHGAAPCPVPVKRRMIEWLGPIVLEYYAATEGTGTFVDSATWLSRPGTVGRPIAEGQVIVADDRGDPVAVGDTGLVFLRAPAGARFDYFGDAGKTQAAFRGEYFTLGDVGRFDEDGYLYLTDRTANLIISGGVNIYPAEVDAVLLEHPAVADVAVIGVINDEWGEEVKAVVEPKAGVQAGPALAEELMGFCRSRLAHFKCPRSVDFVDVLPRQDNGKIYKRLLRDRYRQEASA
jgi:long-chain acyl-CoA synthetase